MNSRVIYITFLEAIHFDEHLVQSGFSFIIPSKFALIPQLWTESHTLLRFLATASISSMKMIQGLFLRASAKRSRTRLAPTPTYISTKSLPRELDDNRDNRNTTHRKERNIGLTGSGLGEESLTSTRRTHKESALRPWREKEEHTLGILAPNLAYLSGFFKKSINSMTSCLASSTPATSAKVTYLHRSSTKNIHWIWSLRWSWPCQHLRCYRCLQGHHHCQVSSWPCKGDRRSIPSEPGWWAGWEELLWGRGSFEPSHRWNRSWECPVRFRLFRTYAQKTRCWSFEAYKCEALHSFQEACSWNLLECLYK